MSLKQDFPIFETHPELIYLDNSSTTQKPSHVIKGIKHYLSSDYANIHRGSYSLSQTSEKLYQQSKQSVAQHIGADNWREIIYTQNATYSLNVLAGSIGRSNMLQKGDTILLSIVEHHANIVPWMILAEDYGLEIRFVGIRDDFSLDIDDLEAKLDSSVKIVALTHVSNVTGEVFDVSGVSQILDTRYGADRPLLIIDGSQSVPHFQVDVAQLGCDALFFTGHKVFADSGIGVLWAKESLLTTLKPVFSGGAAIGHVSKSGFTHSTQLPDAFEPGTPNMSGAVSLLKAFEYIDAIGGYNMIENIEKELSKYTLEKFQTLSEIKLIGSYNHSHRVGVFSFVVDGVHSFDISDYLADHDICIRAGQHCAEPLMEHVGELHSCRMSLHIYNTRQDIDRFFEILIQAINDLK